MRVISHRGYWLKEDERNTQIAFRRSFDLGFGVETDVRDACGKIVISHDTPAGHEMEVAEFLGLLAGRDLPIAFNIKSDGIADALLKAMERSQHPNWFTFDMSIPELVAQIRKGIPAYSRCSEHENPPACYASVGGIWLDSFHGDWFDTDTVERFLGDGKRICIVSPELHGRDPAALWTKLRDSEISTNANLMLCTDHPVRAAGWFKERQQ